MSWSLVQNKAASSTSTNGSVTPTSTPVNGNMMIIAATFNLALSAVTDPTGWTRRASKDRAGSAPCCVILEKIASSESGAYQFTHANQIWSIEFYEWSGQAATGSEFDAASAGNSNASAASLTSGSLTPAVDQELFITVCGQVAGNGSGSGETIDSGFTVIDTFLFNTEITGYKIKGVGDTAAENPTSTWTTLRACSSIQAAFKMATATSSPHSHGATIGASFPTASAVSYGSGDS